MKGKGFCRFSGRGVTFPQGVGLTKGGEAAQAQGSEQAPPAAVNLRSTDVPPSAGQPVWHAIAEVGGSQKFLVEGRYYDCHSLKGVQPGDKVDFNRVLATNTSDGQFVLGKPYVPGARVRARVVENYKDTKKVIFKFKPKKHYKKTSGHRQPMTRFYVERVVYGDQKTLRQEIDELNQSKQ